MADDLERRFCFEVVTPARSSMLQADSEALRKTWLAYLEGGIARALRISASGKVTLHSHNLSSLSVQWPQYDCFTHIYIYLSSIEER